MDRHQLSFSSDPENPMISVSILGCKGDKLLLRGQTVTLLGQTDPALDVVSMVTTYVSRTSATVATGGSWDLPYLHYPVFTNLSVNHAAYGQRLSPRTPANRVTKFLREACGYTYAVLAKDLRCSGLSLLMAAGWELNVLAAMGRWDDDKIMKYHYMNASLVAQRRRIKMTLLDTSYRQSFLSLNDYLASRSH